MFNGDSQPRVQQPRHATQPAIVGLLNHQQLTDTRSWLAGLIGEVVMSTSWPRWRRSRLARKIAMASTQHRSRGKAASQVSVASVLLHPQVERGEL
jgi:photosystem II stability/assembly factor-like uncharacterized protein